MDPQYTRPTGTLALAAALIFLPASLQGQDNEYDRCMTEASSQVTMGMCLSEAYERSDAELNEAYRAAMAAIDQSEHLNAEVISDWKDALRSTQRAWIALRDGNCDQAEFEMWGGSVMGQARTKCLLEQTAQRTSELGGTSSWTSESRPPGPLRGDLALRDTTEWDSQLHAGSAASLYVGEAFIAQVDTDFGAHRVRTGLIYNPIDSIDDGFPEVGPDGEEEWVPIWMTQPAGGVLDDGETRNPLRGMAPMFVDAVSCPSFSPPWMFYWGWDEQGAHAAAYDFRNGTAVSMLLGTVRAETDASCIMGRPRASAQRGEFEFEGETHVLNVGTSR